MFKCTNLRSRFLTKSMQSMSHHDIKHLHFLQNSLYPFLGLPIPTPTLQLKKQNTALTIFKP